MSEQTFTEQEIREAEMLVRDKIDVELSANSLLAELKKSESPSIPEGVLCWGRDAFHGQWVPCEYRQAIAIIEDIIMAYDLPGVTCELDDAIKVAKKLIEERA